MLLFDFGFLEDFVLHIFDVQDLVEDVLEDMDLKDRDRVADLEYMDLYKNTLRATSVLRMMFSSMRIGQLPRGRVHRVL